MSETSEGHNGLLDQMVQAGLVLLSPSLNSNHSALLVPVG